MCQQQQQPQVHHIDPIMGNNQFGHIIPCENNIIPFNSNYVPIDYNNTIGYNPYNYSENNYDHM